MPCIINHGNIVVVNQNAEYNPKPLPYKMNDMDSVFTHWDSKLCKNVSTPNELSIVGDDENK